MKRLREVYQRGLDRSEKKWLRATARSGQIKRRPIPYTTLPWVAFTSFRTREWGRRFCTEDSLRKICKENRRTLLPFSVEVHHALMDGLHVGRYVTRLEKSWRPLRITSSDKLQLVANL